MDATTIRGAKAGQRDMTEFATDLWGESGLGFMGEAAVAMAKTLWQFVAKPPEEPSVDHDLSVDRDAPTEIDE